MRFIEKLCPVHIAAIVFPTLCVFGAQYLGAGAKESFASDFFEEGVDFSQSQFEFSLSRSGQDALSEISSPFYFERIDLDDEQFEPGELEPNPYAHNEMDDEPEMVVTAILPNAKNPLAIIDGKPRRVGDTLESGWTVMAINGKDFSVSFRHKTGKTIRVKMKTVPGG